MEIKSYSLLIETGVTNSLTASYSDLKCCPRKKKKRKKKKEEMSSKFKLSTSRCQGPAQPVLGIPGKGRPQL